MKKTAILGIAALLVATSAYAATVNGVISWAAATGMYWHDSTATDLTPDVIASEGVLAHYDVLWQLIRTPDGQTHVPDLTADDYLSGGDTLIDSRSGNASYYADNFGMDAALYTDMDITTPYAMNTEESYYVYQRVYEATTPVEGTRYWDSGVDQIKYDGVVNRVDVTLEFDGTQVSEVPITANLTVQGPSSVPEPATMSLLGLGALAMVLRRKLRK